MADFLADFALETSSTQGTGTLSLDGAVSGLRTFVAALGTGVTGEFVARTSTYSKWERFRGVITDGSPDTLTRAEILESSNSSAAVDWQAGDAPIYIHCISSAARLSQLRASHRGSSAPANPLQAGMTWADTSGGVTAVVFKYYDGADWITLPWIINETANTVTFSAATFSGAITLPGNPSSALQAAPKQYVDRGDRQRVWGLTYANNGSDATNDIDIAAGGCMDATGAYWIALSALTKRLDAAWAVGTNQGGLDTGSIGNSDYYIWAIARSDTGVTDALFSLSPTAPTMPADYDYKRLIGWFKRVGGSIVAFHTYELPGGGLRLMWDAPTADISLSNTLTTSRRTDAVKAPLDFSVDALLRVLVYDASAEAYALVCSPDETDATVDANNANLHSAATYADTKDLRVRTSAAGLIAARASLATVDSYAVRTLGFEMSRH